ncbi:MAG: methyltransferase [Opitutaceae bacterium]|jgi:(2Fe-2S) ferredoxin/SAM-dependent methyltransferase
MQPFRHHVFICDQRKPEGLPCCAARGSATVIEALRREIAAQALLDVVQVTTCGSLGLCERGPNLVVYPDGVWYSGVGVADVPEIVREHFKNGRPVERLLNRDVAAVKREITENRSRMAAALKAREAAGVLPDELMGMIRGYQESRILLTAIELDVFTAVERRAGQATATGVAAELQTDARATGKLLNALVALGLLTKQANAFANAPAARRFFVAGTPDDARMALRHNLSLWATWSTLTQCVREGHVVRNREMQDRDDDWTTPFIAAMHRNAALRAPLMVQAVGAEGICHLLDVGGGSGAYSIAFARANPALRAEVFDLATVVPLATKHIAEAGLGDRVGTRVGDLRKDALGSGYDLVLLSAICHMLDPNENRDLMRRAFQALVPGGRIVIQDHIMNADKTSPRAGALFAINMLVGTAGGSTYSEDEYAQWLREAGFAQVRRLPLPGPNDLVIAQRP